MKLRNLIGALAMLFAGAASAQQCYYATILEPSPFMGTANEIIIFDDGTIWKDLTYAYLYLYEYNPRVVLCPSTGRMMLKDGSTQHVFTLQRLR